MRRINPLVIIFHHLPLFKPQPIIKFHSILIANLNMKHDFLDSPADQFLTFLTLCKLQHRLHEPTPHVSPSVRRQDAQRHNVDVVILDTTADGPDDESVVVRKFTEILVFGFDHVFVEPVGVCYWEAGCVDEPELFHIV